MRLTLHTAAYWLILTMHDAIPAAHALATADVATVRLRLSKLATRVIETASRVRLAFAAARPEATSSATSRRALMPAGPINPGSVVAPFSFPQPPAPTKPIRSSSDT